MILDLLIKSLGKPSNTKSRNLQYKFNCPKCAEENGYVVDNKYNLEVNLNKGNYKNNKVFHCWKCGYSGTVKSLLYQNGNIEDYKKYIELDLDNIFYGDNLTIIDDYDDVVIPKDFIPFTKINRMNEIHLKALYYLYNRNINDNIINYFKLGFCTSGKYANRILIPSFDKNGVLNYFVTRTFLKNIKPKYLNPHEDKTKFIFNELNINWNLPVFLVEGGFDMLTIPFNTIPLLGKILHPILLNKILDYNTPIIILLDPDAKKDSNIIYETLKDFGHKQVYNINIPKEDINEILVNQGIEKLFDIITSIN